MAGLRRVLEVAAAVVLGATALGIAAAVAENYPSRLVISAPTWSPKRSLMATRC